MKRTAAPAAGRKRKRSWILPLAVLVFAVYVVVMLAQLHMELNEREKVLAEYEQRTSQAQRDNEDKQNELDHKDILMEKAARMQGYGRRGETVFQEIPGTDSTER